LNANPEEGFDDLFHDDFIMVAGCVSRRKLERIMAGLLSHMGLDLDKSEGNH